MKWNRAFLKQRGKVAFRSNYGRSVLAALILSFASGGIVFNTASLSEDQLTFLIESMSVSAALKVLRAAVPGLVLTLIVEIFLLIPLTVGCRRFFVRNSSAPATVSECISAFKSNYWNVVLVMFVQQIYLFLWGLLFVIPGIVKTYSYRMVPYILAENPDISANEAIGRSRRMMKGHKWDVFVLDLSFLGWTLLSAFTCGILTYLYVMPYIYATDAELYLVLSGRRSTADNDSGAFGTGAGAGGYGPGGAAGDRYGSGGGYGQSYDEDGPYDEPDRHDDDYYG